MISAREAEVTGYRIKDAIMNVRFSEPRGPTFHYGPPTKDYFGDQPHERDPLDKKYIYLGPSLEMPLAGEGAFAARDIPAGTMVALYGGRVMSEEESRKVEVRYREELIEKRGLFPNSSEFIDTWKYNHQIKTCQLRIKIPPEYESSEKYQGTLGHKVNHKFPPNNNCVYSKWVDSARFGPIISVKSVRDVKEGEELFADYSYNVTSVDLPWYKELYRKHLEDMADKNTTDNFNHAEL